MCKNLKNLNKNQKIVLTVILVTIHIVVITFLISCFLCPNKRKSSQSNQVLIKQEEIPEPYKAGGEGELTEEEIKNQNILPPLSVISNTSGKIIQVRLTSILVKGDGSNFVDQQPRDLTVNFTDSTITSNNTKNTSYSGLEGLKYLQAGMDIVIQGAENIRGKTEFYASIINIINN